MITRKPNTLLSRREIFWLVFGAILFHWGLNYLDQFFGLIAVFTGIIFPFLLGGGIAFLLNLPCGLNRALAPYRLWKNAPDLQTASKGSPSSQYSSYLAIVGSVISGIAAVVVPQVSATIQTVGRECNTFLSGLQAGRGRRRVASFPVDEEFGLDVAEFSSALSRLSWRPEPFCGQNASRC